jgi:hypothetical protein
MVTDDLVQLIVDDGLGTFATDLFVGGFPVSAPDLCVAVTEYGGPAGVDFFGEVTPTLERPRVQVRVRGEAYDYDGPRTRLELIYQALGARSAFTVNGVRYLDLSPIQTPFPMGKDESNRWMFAVNFEALKERQTRMVPLVEVGAGDAFGVRNTGG